MSGELSFLSFLRTGLASRLEAPADESGWPAVAAAAVTAAVRVSGAEIARDVRVRGPGDVEALRGGVVVRETPVGGTDDFEPNLFPAVEIQPADLPWQFTPCGPSPEGRLAPWLVLVVVEKGPDVHLLPSRPLPRLTVPTAQLPDLAEAWAWAHVQITGELTGTVEEAWADDPERFRARLVCPRQLAAGRRYLAALVPAFRSGRLAGLGSTAPADDVAPAWSGEPEVELPVYHSFEFATGPEGDFEALVRRLEARTIEAGHADLDVTDPAPGRITPDSEAIVSLAGALVAPGSQPRRWDRSYRRHTRQVLRQLLDDTLEAPPSDPRPYDPLQHDPVVAPPAYGARSTGAAAIPNGDTEPAWLAELNLDLDHRAVAGLGAEVVRKNQEALLADAWEQVDGLTGINQLLQRTRLAAEVGERAKARRIAPLGDGALLQRIGVSARRLRTADGATVYGELARGAAPTPLASGALQRATRRGSRALRAMSASSPTRRVSDAFVADPERALGYASLVAPRGSSKGGMALYAELLGASATLAPNPSPELESATRQAEEAARAEEGTVVLRHLATATTGTDLGELARKARDAVAPERTLARKLRAQIGAPPDAWSRAVPARMRHDPTLGARAYTLLRDLDPELLLPGLGEVPLETVGLVETRPAFVEAFLCGANDELAREFAWRGFPARPRGTWMRSFWGDRADIAPIEEWTEGGLGAHPAAGAPGAALVLVIRGTLLRRYPETRIYAAKAAWNRRGTERELSAAREVKDPAFEGRLDRHTRFVAFELTRAAAEGDPAGPGADGGWYFVLEEPATDSRFGMDEGADELRGATPAHWQELSWQHLVSSAADPDALAHVPLDTPFGEATLPESATRAEPATWGASAADLARITLQDRVRMLVHATAMLGDGR